MSRVDRAISDVLLSIGPSSYSSFFNTTSALLHLFSKLKTNLDNKIYQQHINIIKDFVVTVTESTDQTNGSFESRLLVSIYCEYNKPDQCNHPVLENYLAKTMQKRLDWLMQVCERTKCMSLNIENLYMLEIVLFIIESAELKCQPLSVEPYCSLLIAAVARCL